MIESRMSRRESKFRQAVHDDMMTRLGSVIDPELGRSITDLGMVVGLEVSAIEGQPIYDDLGPESQQRPSYKVTVHLELTVPGCPLSETIIAGIKQAASDYLPAHLTTQTVVDTMSKEKLTSLVAELREARRKNPFHKKGIKTRIFAVASGKGGVGKSAVSANLAATFAAMGYSTAAIDADIYGFSLPRLFGVHSQPTNLDGMLMPVESWGVKLMSIGMFAGSERAILWRGPRLRRLVGRAGCARHRPAAGDRGYDHHRGAGPAQCGDAGGHHPAALRFRHRRPRRPGQPSAADQGRWGDREHVLV